MSDKIENPSAFPSSELVHSHGQESKSIPGMSLRDYFAAIALPHFIIANDGPYTQDAIQAYAAADAMLKVRML